MTDKILKLSETIVNYSINVQKNERVLITTQGLVPADLVKALIKDINSREGIANVKIIDEEIWTLLLENTNEERINLLKKILDFEVHNYDSFISIYYNTNDYEEKNVDADIRKKLGAETRELSNIRTNKRKWVLLQYPSELDAYKAKMKIDEFREFSFDVMCVDYALMAENIKPLKELIEKTDKVRITAKDTDLTFSIKDIGAIPCCGNFNIPDGEIFTAPVKDSVNGVITFNTPSPYRGMVYNQVQLTFENGKIVKATSLDDDTQLNRIFDTDGGSRYLGEFAFGLNPLINYPMMDILFDEKINGSIHLAVGSCYEEATNGNDSSVHWDLVLIQREEYGGGNIYFDDVLVRENGKFVLPELEKLN